MVFQLDPDKIAFPNPVFGEKEGILAVGGDLKVERLQLAYRHGIFPWYSFRDSMIQWWCPMDRFVIFPKEIHISHSMRQVLASRRFKVTMGKSFAEVIQNCAAVNQRNEMKGAWLGEDMMEAYQRLHEERWATSVEVWEEGRLVGGLYGVMVNSVFAGESMFSLVPNASKVALIRLAQLLAPYDMVIDCQLETAHLKSMGGRHIPYEELQRYLSRPIARKGSGKARDEALQEPKEGET